MDNRVRDALANNVALYEAVFRTHGVAHAIRGDIWLALDPPPSYYSNAIALSRKITSAEVAAALEDVAEGSVKDSFACLDLHRHGYEILFSAHWIYRQARPAAGATILTWSVVDSMLELASYRQAHGSADSILPGLLSDPDVTVAIGRSGKQMAAGAIFNRSGDVVGISNVFIAMEKPALGWRDLILVAAERYPARAIVGYESGDELTAAIAAGFLDIGELRIWVK